MTRPLEYEAGPRPRRGARFWRGCIVVSAVLLAISGTSTIAHFCHWGIPVTAGTVSASQNQPCHNFVVYGLAFGGWWLPFGVLAIASGYLALILLMATLAPMLFRKK